MAGKWSKLKFTSKHFYDENIRNIETSKTLKNQNHRNCFKMKAPKHQKH